MLEVLELLGEVVGGEIEPEIRGLGNPEGEIDRQYVDSGEAAGDDRLVAAGRPARRPRPHRRLVSRAPGAAPPSRLRRA